MTFARRPDNGLERPVRSMLADLTVMPDARLRRRRIVLVISLAVFAPLFVAGCVGLASNPTTLGLFMLAAGATVLGVIQTAASIGGLVRVAKEFETRRWARALDARDHPDDPEAGHRE